MNLRPRLPTQCRTMWGPSIIPPKQAMERPNANKEQGNDNQGGVVTKYPKDAPTEYGTNDYFIDRLAQHHRLPGSHRACLKGGVQTE